MTRYAMVIDTKTCIGCGDCVVACKTENKVPEGLNRDWVVEATQGHLPGPDDGVPLGALQSLLEPDLRDPVPDGREPPVEGHQHRARRAEQVHGLQSLHRGLPYDARLVMHPDGYIDKCTFCHHRVEQGLDPACVSSCPTKCMHFGSLDDPNSEVSQLLKTRKHNVLSPETGNEPNVYYLEKE